VIVNHSYIFLESEFIGLAWLEEYCSCEWMCWMVCGSAVLLWMAVLWSINVRQKSSQKTVILGDVVDRRLLHDQNGVPYNKCFYSSWHEKNDRWRQM